MPSKVIVLIVEFFRLYARGGRVEEVLPCHRRKRIVCDRIEDPLRANDIMYTLIYDHFNVIGFNASQLGFK